MQKRLHQRALLAPQCGQAPLKKNLDTHAKKFSLAENSPTYLPTPHVKSSDARAKFTTYLLPTTAVVPYQKVLPQVKLQLLR